MIVRHFPPMKNKSSWMLLCFLMLNRLETNNAFLNNLLPSSSTIHIGCETDIIILPRVNAAAANIHSSSGVGLSSTSTHNSYDRDDVDNSINDDDGITNAMDTATAIRAGKDDVGGYDPGDKLQITREPVTVGDPQLKVKKKEPSIERILQELAMIQKEGPKKYCIIGTRHCSYLHQQIVELLAYALVLSGNQVWTSGAGGTHMATIRGALRAGTDDLLHVVIPQSLSKQPKESQELIQNVTNLIDFPERDQMSLSVASQLCNSYMINHTDQLISFAFHESSTVIEAAKEAKEMEKVVTTLYLD